MHETVFELVDFDAFWCFCCFLFHLFQDGKMFPFEDFFSLGETKKKSHLGQDQVTRKDGVNRGQAVFNQKLQNTQCSVAQRTHKSPIMKLANALEES